MELALRDAFPGGYLVRSQKPLALGQSSVPEPDVYVTRGRIRDFIKQHPTSAEPEVEVEVEVADTIVAFDLGGKLAVYATAGIQEYWVVVIPEHVLAVHREPDPQSGSYRSTLRLGADETISPLAVPEARILVADLLP